jgi:PadR family transcriptional regulator PadR
VTDHLGSFEQLVLLALLRLGEHAYGVSIRQDIEQRTGRSVSAGAVYTALERMERRGLVRSWLGEPTPVRGGKRKRFYALQPRGEEALRRAVEAVRSMAHGLEAGVESP